MTTRELIEWVLTLVIIALAIYGLATVMDQVLMLLERAG